MGNNDREIINNICNEQNFEELLLEITSTIKSNKLNKILNDIENDNRLSKELKKSIYEDFFDYITGLNQSYISGIKKIFCIGAKRALNKIEEKNSMKGSENMSIKTRLIIADDDVHICNFIKESLNKHDDIEILGVANTDEDEIRMIEELKPDIVITDLMRNHKYTALEIIKDYFKKQSPVQFLVVSADRKEDVITDGLEVAGYLQKSFSFDYELLYSEIKRISLKLVIDNINKIHRDIERDEGESRLKKYNNLAYIDLYFVFDENERNTLRKLGIDIEDKKYTECEFTTFRFKINQYLEIDEEPEIVEELKDTRMYIEDKGVSQEEFDKIIEKLNLIYIL